LQITNSSTLVGYANFMAFFAYGNMRFGNDKNKNTFVPDYTDERALAGNPDALLDHLDTLLTSGTLSTETRNNIKLTLNAIPMTSSNDASYDGPGTRVGTAILMVMTSPDYLVQH
jgi:hypothetical protein